MLHPMLGVVWLERSSWDKLIFVHLKASIALMAFLDLAPEILLAQG